LLGPILSLTAALSILGCAAAPPAGSAAKAQEPKAAERAAAAETKPPQPPAAKPQPPAMPNLAIPRVSPTAPIAGTSNKLEPPDGKWLIDEQGREYFTTEVPRVEGQYEWASEDHKKVRLAYGLLLDVASYDESKILVKIYRPGGPPPRPARASASPEEVEAGYRVSLPSVDRLRFVSFGAGLPTEGQWRQGFAIADINGDGHLDIVHGPVRKGSNRPAIFLGDGKGNWRPWKEATFPAVAFDYGDVAVGDLNGDGHPDLVVASHLRGISALVNDGKGNFRLWSQGIDFQSQPPPGATELPFSSRAVQIFDWNHDGKADIVALGEGPRFATSRGAGNADFSQGSRGILIYLNQGNGTWTKTGGNEGRGAVFGDNLVLGDFNGDGIQDFLTASGVLGSRALLNLGKADGTWQPVAVEALRPNAIFQSVSAGDFDHDGHLDLAVGYLSSEAGVWRTGVDVLLARPGGAWQRVALANEKSQAGLTAIGAGDLDGDGALDVVALTGDGRGWVFLGDGKGGFVRQEGSALGEPGCGGYHVELADLDGDGRAEIVASFAGEAGSLLAGGGGGGTACSSGGSLRAWKAVAARKGEPKK
jgi:hypothetical protein